jgi:hypothetical protein
MIIRRQLIGKDGWPTNVPTGFTVPANAIVTLHVVNFDGTTPIDAQYAKTSGTLDTETVQPISVAA